jgi:hypothetical protein
MSKHEGKAWFALSKRIEYAHYEKTEADWIDDDRPETEQDSQKCSSTTDAAGVSGIAAEASRGCIICFCRCWTKDRLFR